VTDQNTPKDTREESRELNNEPTIIPGDPNNTYLPPLPSESDEDRFDEQKSPFRRVWDRYSYSAVRIYLTQFAIGLFGASIAISTAKNLNGIFLATGIFSLLFFIALLHPLVWNIGSSDRIAVDGGRRKRNLLTGMWLGLAAGIPNFLFALLYTVTFLFGAEGTIAAAISAVMKVIMMFSEGMYWSFICYFRLGDLPLHSYWWVYFVMAGLTVLFVTVSYLLGYYNIGLPKIFASKGEEAERAEREKHRKPTRKD